MSAAEHGIVLGFKEFRATVPRNSWNYDVWCTSRPYPDCIWLITVPHCVVVVVKTPNFHHFNSENTIPLERVCVCVCMCTSIYMSVSFLWWFPRGLCKTGRFKLLMPFFILGMNLANWPCSSKCPDTPLMFRHYDTIPRYFLGHAAIALE